MTSAVKICSNALQRLGEDPIQSFTDGNEQTNSIKRGRLCNNLWPSVRDGVLGSHLWNCAVRRVVLSPTVDAPAFGYAKQFMLPGDFMRVMAINDVPTSDYDYSIESDSNGARVLLCDAGSVNLRYTWSNIEPNNWDKILIEGMELAMEAALAYPITRSSAKEELANKKYMTYMQRVRSIDGQQGTPETLGDFPLLQARNL